MRACLVVCCLIALAGGALAARAGRPLIIRCEVTGTIDPGSANYLEKCVRVAEERGASALLVRLDTPGGALESTRQIVRAFLGARVPVVVWVGPSGAHAGSAGVFITLAGNVAAMAPGTNIGAAHPVMGPTGDDPEKAGKEMARKVENDAVAFVEAIARQRGRNVEWAASAVRESASVAAEEAVRLKVVDLIAENETALLAAIHGRAVTTGSGTATVETADADVVAHEPGLQDRIVHWLANPGVAYVLFLIGVLGIAAELSNPGLVVPGLVGVVCLILALVAMATLPVRAGAVALMLLGVAFLITELFLGHGALAAVGVLLVGIGGALLMDRFDLDWFVEPSFRLPLRLVVPTVATLGGLAAFGVYRAAQARRMIQRGGDVGMVGEKGRALSEIGSVGGEAFVHGEIWRARSRGVIPAGAPVVVRRVDGLVLEVEEDRS
ncbi:MAG TPA: nodulation protein NfeD [Myxococcaceae bacterium]|nr:nodulation protein NfeD [Myxococcaceae bacterium]